MYGLRVKIHSVSNNGKRAENDITFRMLEMSVIWIRNQKSPSALAHTVRITNDQISAIRIDASIKLAEAADDDPVLCSD